MNPTANFETLLSGVIHLRPEFRSNAWQGNGAGQGILPVQKTHASFRHGA